MSHITQTQRNEAILSLRGQLRPGETVYTSLKHVSKSGMMRVIRLFVLKENRPIDITRTVATAGVGPYNRRHKGLKLVSSGTDMGFEAVYTLGRIIFPDGFDLAPNRLYGGRWHGRNNSDSHRDEDGGYALRQEWI